MSSHSVTGNIPLPNIDSSVFTNTSVASEGHVECDVDSLASGNADRGKEIALLTPVPTMRECRVAGASYACDTRAAIVSLMMALRTIFKFCLEISVDH